jgi:hypothetical protein
MSGVPGGTSVKLFEKPGVLSELPDALVATTVNSPSALWSTVRFNSAEVPVASTWVALTLILGGVEAGRIAKLEPVRFVPVNLTIIDAARSANLGEREVSAGGETTVKLRSDSAV